MKIQTECVPCLLKRIIFESELSTTDKEVQTAAIRKACQMLSEIYSPDVCSADIATRVHKVVYDTLNDTDPYRDLKRRSNEIAQSLLPKIEGLISKSEDSLKTSMICSIIGNVMDFGIEGVDADPEVFDKVFDQLYSERLGFDDYLQVKKLLSMCKRVVLFTDNCGEIVFDKVLCRELKRFKPDVFLSLVVRGEPIISDATLDDVELLDFQGVVDEVLTTGCFAIGVDFKNLPGRLKEVLDSVDLIICKGMANYEAFSEELFRPIVFLLRTKCRAIANSMGLPMDVSVIKLYD